MGWSKRQWAKLSQTERFDWLAFEVRREEQLGDLMHTLMELEYSDLSAVTQVMLEQL